MGDEDEFVDTLEVVGDQGVELEALGQFLQVAGHLGEPLLELFGVMRVVGFKPLVAYPGLEVAVALVGAGVEGTGEALTPGPSP